jgi:integrase/recombinase XerD
MLSRHVARYVALSRRLGLQFDEQERTLELYASYAEVHGDRYTLVKRIYEWCATASSPNCARTWFDTIRRFCIFLNAEEPAHEVPPANVFGRGKRPRPAPYILQPDQIRAIMHAALDLPPKGSISPHTYHHLFGLLAATGLRVSEALALQRHDLTDDGLVVRRGKFGKSRLVPLHPTVRRALADYMVIRDGLGGDGSDMFVVSRTKRAPSTTAAYCIFVRLARQLGFRGPPGTRGPRLHDLRHTFAVRSLESCAQDRTAVAHHMAALSTYLGHADVANTYWYLQATPVLMHGIAEASEQLFQGGAA